MLRHSRTLGLIICSFSTVFRYPMSRYNSFSQRRTCFSHQHVTALLRAAPTERCFGTRMVLRRSSCIRSQTVLALHLHHISHVPVSSIKIPFR
jgi:hypothetical protein